MGSLPGLAGPAGSGACKGSLGGHRALVKTSTAVRHPKTTVVEKTSSKGGKVVSRSPTVGTAHTRETTGVGAGVERLLNSGLSRRGDTFATDFDY